MPFLTFRRDHLRSTSGIICGPIWGSFPGGDYLRSGIICGVIQISAWKRKGKETAATQANSISVISKHYYSGCKYRETFISISLGQKMNPAGHPQQCHVKYSDHDQSCAMFDGIHNIEDNTWVGVDMEFLLECST